MICILGLARGLVSRRNPDLMHKQHAFKIAENISEAMYDHLTWKRLGILLPCGQ